MRPFKTHRKADIGLVLIGCVLLSACGENQYGPPVPGRPLTWGQQHYLDNQGYSQAVNDGSAR
jgi:hypothetical protein